MKIVYEARDSLEGHMIANLLEQAGIFARVDGDFLQGGVGELQAFGLVKVRVNADDFDRARDIVRQWEATQASTANGGLSANKLNYVHIGLSFILGMLVGMLMMAS
ncbi:MAG: DUF2007 domain-containing protein [Ketobacteraceae bacterium]|nr:DUF2007 domain-containing protein [Ketobacteraceae bacterium]